MRKKNYKGRCEKRVLSKCKGICRTYDALQYAYADMLEENEEVKEFQCNVQLNSEEYTTDFFCEMENGDVIIMITKVKCYNCGEEIKREEGYENKDGYLCESCYYEDFIICKDCGTLIPAESATYNENEAIWINVLR